MTDKKIPPKPGKDTIYVDVDDEITSIIDKVDNAKQKVVALVLPKRAATLQSIVNMKLLKKSAQTSGKSVVLITSEEALLPLAGAAGLHVAKNLQSKPFLPDGPDLPKAVPVTEEAPSELDEEPEAGEEENLPGKIDYSQSIGELAAAHVEENPEDAIELDDEDGSPAPAAANKKKPKISKDKALKVPNFDRFRLLLFGGIATLIALIIFIFMAIFVLPKATVTIQASSIPISTSFNLTTSDTATAFDEQKGVIPSKLATSDQTSTQQVQATGQQNNGKKAVGSVTFINCSHDGSSASVPTGTGISTSDGLSYITQSAASMPNSAYFGTCKSGIPNSSATVDIVAVKPGTKYNIGSSSFTVSCATCSNVSASGSASNGTDDMQTVLTQADVDGAKAKITSADSDKFTKTFEQQQSDQGYYVLTSTLKIGDPAITATPAVGQPASTANVSIKITYTVLTIKKDDLQKAITDKLNKQFDSKKQKISNDVLKGATVTVTNQSAPAIATLSIGEDTTAVPIINVAALKKQIEGQKAGDVKAVVSALPGVKDVSVKFSPFWVSKVPKKDAKVNIVIQEVRTNTSQP